MRKKVLAGVVVVFALSLFLTSVSFAAEAEKEGPWDGFTLTPKIGYAYFGGQGNYNVSSTATTTVNSTNALLIQLNLDFGKKGGFELAPWFAYEKMNATVNLIPTPVSGTDTAYGLGLYLGGPFYRWELHGAGVWYPGIGMGWRIGYVLGSDLYNYAIQTGLEIPISVTWYPSASTHIGITLEWANGFGSTMGATVQNTGTATSKAEFGVSYGYWTNLLIGVRFF